MKMHAKSSKNEVALKNLNVLCDIKFIHQFPYILAMFECVHVALIKSAQS